MEEEFRAKRKRINILEKDTKMIKEELQGTVSCLDFSYICSLFLVANDKSVLHHDNIQKRKLKNLLEISLKEVINDSHDPNKVIWSNGVVVKALDSQSRGPVFKTTGWLQG